MLGRTLLISTALVAVPAAGFAQTTAASETPHDYFVAHSFGFPANFREYHPGPKWILDNSTAFKLTDAQSTKLKAIAKQMFDDVASLDKTSQAAYMKYKDDSSSPTASASTLEGDIDGIGKADEALAYTMIPYHLQGYALLTPAQQQTYLDLARKLQTAK